MATKEPSTLVRGSKTTYFTPPPTTAKESSDEPFKELTKPVEPITPPKSSQAAVLTPPSSQKSLNDTSKGAAKPAESSTPSKSSQVALAVFPGKDKSLSEALKELRASIEELRQPAEKLLESNTKHAASTGSPTEKTVPSSNDKADSLDKAAKAYLTPPASPVPQVRSLEELVKAQSTVTVVPLFKDDKEAQRPKLLSATTIINKLSINAWTCHGAAQKGPCGFKSHLTKDSKQTEIRRLIDKLSTVDMDSKAFDSALEDLAKSYSCYNHNKEGPLDIRMKKWRNLLIPPTELRAQVYAALWEIILTCPDCGNRIGGQKVQNCQMTRKLILDYNGGNMEYYKYLLEVWNANTRCSNHSDQSNGDVKITTLLTKIRTIVPASSTTSITPSMSKSARLHWPTATITSFWAGVHTYTDPDGEPDPLNLLKLRVQKELRGKELESGYVYIYTVEDNDTMLKLGYTGSSAEDRRADWQFNCNRKTRIRHHQYVSHAKHVEGICHADMHKQRVQVYCDGCLTNHNEWFRIELATAQAVLDKWAAWIRSAPYDIRTLRSGNLGHLKDRSRLSDIEAFRREPLLKA